MRAVAASLNDHGDKGDNSRSTGNVERLCAIFAQRTEMFHEILRGSNKGHSSEVRIMDRSFIDPKHAILPMCSGSGCNSKCVEDLIQRLVELSSEETVAEVRYIMRSTRQRSGNKS